MLDRLEKTIKKLGRVVKAATELALATGTLIAILKMILEDLFS